MLSDNSQDDLLPPDVVDKASTTMDSASESEYCDLGRKLERLCMLPDNLSHVCAELMAAELTAAYAIMIYKGAIEREC